MLLNRLCVIQIGSVMMLMDVKDELINPLRLTFDCIDATIELVDEDGIEVDSLYDDENEFYDKDGYTPSDED